VAHMDMGMFRVASAEGKGGDNPSGELSGYAQERTREQELSWKLDALAAIGIADKSILQRASGIPKLFIRAVRCSVQSHLRPPGA
jgi:hypothetical protein